MNLGTLFRKDDQDKLRIDLVKLRECTESEFMNYFTAAVPDFSVDEMKFSQHGRNKFVYFRIEGVYYSFAWDGRNKRLLANREDKSGKWSMIVGYQKQ